VSSRTARAIQRNPGSKKKKKKRKEKKKEKKKRKKNKIKKTKVTLLSFCTRLRHQGYVGLRWQE
jgi:hypothetical protein